MAQGTPLSHALTDADEQVCSCLLSAIDAIEIVHPDRLPEGQKV